jgi:hypothetical protein
MSSSSTNSNKTGDLFGFLNGQKCGIEALKMRYGNGKKCRMERFKNA